MQKTVAVLQ